MMPDHAHEFDQIHRPQFHFTARAGWLNDPNGLVFYKGEYHLFYQHNPLGVEWGNMTWGHAISRDLVHWEHLPNAIEPDERATIFSGSAVVDRENSAGLQDGSEKTLVAFYTAAGKEKNPYTQCLAFSRDAGRRWEKWEGNPILAEITAGNRDPKVIWHAPSRRWVMVLYVTEWRPPIPLHTIQFFTSMDLKHWEFQSKVDGFFECPDLFELPVEGDPHDRRWILMGGDGRYCIGAFDGRRFTTLSGKHTGDWGANFYAAQTFSDIPESDGRRILIGWMRGGRYPGMPFNQQMTFPCRLTLRNFPEGPRLCKYPVEEITRLHGRVHRWEGVSVQPGENPLATISGDLFDVEVQIEPGHATEFGFELHGSKISYVVGDQVLVADGQSARLELLGGQIKLRILLDRTSIELFGNDGRVTMSWCILPKPQQQGLTFYAMGGAARIASMKIRELRSIWQGRQMSDFARS